MAGIPDDAPVYFEHPRETLPSGTTLSQSDYDYLKDLARGDHDREWDLYSYNFCGHSGSFYYKKDFYGSLDSIIPTSATDLIIRYVNAGNGYFLVTDTEGTTYKFSERETTGRYLEAAGPEPPFGEATVEMTAQSSSTVTAWYLTEIATADRTDVITLTYESMDYFSTERRSFSRTYNFSYIYNGSGSYDWIGDYANASTSHAIRPATS